MNDRFRNDRGRGRQGEPLYSSDEDETLGSEWERDRAPRYGQGARFGQGTGYDQSGNPRFGQGGSAGNSGSGFHNRGNAGMYGSGSTGYVGGRGSSGYGGNTGTDYGRGGYSGRAGGDYEGGSYGASTTRGDGQVAWGGAPSSRPSGGFAGRGPKGYVRTDERIREDVCERLSADDNVDASDIEVRVDAGEVTLEGTVPTRSMKHGAENLADEVTGVKDVHNRLRVTTGLLTEIKEKVTGEEKDRHYANGGTKATSANGTI